MRQAQKMEAVGRLAGGIAHDFNNVLTAILGYGQLLADKVQATPELAEDVAEILKAGERPRPSRGNSWRSAGTGPRSRECSTSIPSSPIRRRCSGASSARTSVVTANSDAQGS